MNPSANPAESNDGDRLGNRLHPVFWLGGLIGTGLLSRWIIQWNQSLPLCGFRSLTGVPCPLCGGTRAVKSLTELDVASAMAMNPLVGLGALAVAVWLVVGLVDRVLGTRMEWRLTRVLRRLPLTLVVLGLFLANWAYLIYFLP